MREKRDSVVDRRSLKGRRRAYDLEYSLNGGTERRIGEERRTEVERREGWIRMSDWYSVFPWDAKRLKRRLRKQLP